VFNEGNASERVSSRLLYLHILTNSTNDLITIITGITKIFKGNNIIDRFLPYLPTGTSRVKPPSPEPVKSY
jgi:hypothetical protein